MKKAIRYKETLLYYDGPLVFLGEDRVGTFFICQSIDVSDNATSYLCVPVSRNRVHMLNKATIDLRTIFVEPEVEEYYLCNLSELYEFTNILTSIDKERITEEWLPEEGLYLSEPVPEVDIVLNRSKEVSKPIIHVTLDPPEAQAEHKIHADRLAGFLSSFQNLIKYLYRWTYKKGCVVSELLDKKTAHLVDVTAFAGGSFTVEFEPLDYSNLFGECGLSNCLELLDEFNTKIDNAERALEFIQAHKGHLAGSYVRFLEFLRSSNTTLKYTWAYPSLKQSITKTIKTESIDPVLELCYQKAGIATEEVTFVGRVTKADKTGKTWKIRREEDKKEFSGKIKDGVNITLDGIVIENVLYRFICEEFIEEVSGTGKETKQYLLVQYEEI